MRRWWKPRRRCRATRRKTILLTRIGSWSGWIYAWNAIFIKLVSTPHSCCANKRERKMHEIKRRTSNERTENFVISFCMRNKISGVLVVVAAGSDVCVCAFTCSTSTQINIEYWKQKKISAGCLWILFVFDGNEAHAYERKKFTIIVSYFYR